MNRRLAVATLATAVLAAAGGTVASASGNHAQHATAKGVTSGPFHFDFNATRAAGAPANQASGVFDAHVPIGGSTLVHFQGPVTCLDVRGNSVGLFYPVSASQPALLAKGMRGIYIFMRVDGKGNATGASFSPSARPYTAACTPVPGLAPATGHGTADS